MGVLIDRGDQAAVALESRWEVRVLKEIKDGLEILNPGRSIFYWEEETSGILVAEVICCDGVLKKIPSSCVEPLNELRLEDWQCVPRYSCGRHHLGA